LLEEVRPRPACNACKAFTWILSEYDCRAPFDVGHNDHCCCLVDTDARSNSTLGRTSGVPNESIGKDRMQVSSLMLMVFGVLRGDFWLFASTSHKAVQLICYCCHRVRCWYQAPKGVLHHLLGTASCFLHTANTFGYRAACVQAHAMCSTHGPCGLKSLAIAAACGTGFDVLAAFVLLALRNLATRHVLLVQRCAARLAALISPRPAHFACLCIEGAVRPYI
jgi:hypothetical protein